MATPASPSSLGSLDGFQLIQNYSDLAPYSGQIVAVRGSSYFQHTSQAFTFSEIPDKFAHVSSQVIDKFEGGKGYGLNTLYKADATKSATIANKKHYGSMILFM